MKNVWIIYEGSPGHLSQSIGFAKVLAQLCPLRTHEVFGRTRVRGWQRHLIRYCMGKKGRLIPERLLYRIAEVRIPDGAGTPDLIISSGGKSVFAARTLAGRYAVPYVFIGERKPYPAEWFHTIISPAPGESCANSIDVELIPTPVTPEFIAQKGTVQKGLWCMIIGGASRTHRFKEKDWMDMAEGMNALAEREKIRWLLTTSRRTGAAAELILKKHLNPDILDDAIWWAEKPRKELYAFMARSEVLFVTQDSVTMVTEAVSSGRPVVTVFPNTVVIPENSFMHSYFARLESSLRIKRVGLSGLSALQIVSNSFSLFQEGQLHVILEELIGRLRWAGPVTQHDDKSSRLC